MATTYEPSKPVVVEENGYRMARGATRLPDVSVRFDPITKSMRLSGKLEYLSMKGGALESVQMDLTGLLDKDGFISLKNHRPDLLQKSEPRIVAKATCLSEAGSCLSSFIDIYLYSEGVVYHHQIESHQEGVESSRPVIDEGSEETEGGADEVEGEPGQYVGTIIEDIEKLLEVKPVPAPAKGEPKKEEPKKELPKKEEPKKEEPKKDEPKSGHPNKEEPKPEPPKKETPKKEDSKPASQAIGPVNAGRLENAVNILKYQQSHNPAGFYILRPQRLTHFATSELAYILAQIGEFTKTNLPGSLLAVGDLSREKGGALGSHKSHQNGLDADVAYYFNNKTFNGYFASAVAVDKPHANWMIEAQWKLFKNVVGTKLIDRIFIHDTLKKALCNLAIQNGEVRKDQADTLAYQTLRRLISDTAHDNHFHLRVKCSSAQVRCRQMAEPAPGSGCF